MSEAVIRPATLADLSRIQELNHALFMHDFPRDPTMNTNWPYEEAGVDFFTKRITHWIGQVGVGACFAAEADETVVGYICGRADHKPKPFDTVRRAEIENVYVEESYRDRGIGAQLVEQLAQWCKARGAEHLYVVAHADNADAIGFYKKLGLRSLSLRLDKEL